MRKYVGVVSASLLLIGAMSLVGCSSKKTAMVASGSDGADAYGLSGQGGAYSGGAQKDQYGRVVNALTAPANQTYYFSYDSNAVESSDYKALSIQANYLASHPSAKVRLEGNTDNRGSREYNIGLGWRRDQAVARMLEQQGVKANQINMVSYGKERPAAVGDSEDAWQLNRRVELVYEAN